MVARGAVIRDSASTMFGGTDHLRFECSGCPFTGHTDYKVNKVCKILTEDQCSNILEIADRLGRYNVTCQ